MPNNTPLPDLLLHDASQQEMRHRLENLHLVAAALSDRKLNIKQRRIQARQMVERALSRLQ